MRAVRSSLIAIAFVAGPLLINACSGKIQSTNATDQEGTARPPDVRNPIKPSPTKTPAPPSPDPQPQPSTDAGTTATDSGAPVSDAGLTDGDSPDAADPDASPDAAAPNSCSASATYDTCVDCCDTKNPGGWEVADDAWFNCICTAPGVCAAACASTLCSPAGAAPSAACGTCLDSNAAVQCDTAADNACKASPACLAADQCVVASNCEAKP